MVSLAQYQSPGTSPAGIVQTVIATHNPPHRAKALLPRGAKWIKVVFIHTPFSLVGGEASPRQGVYPSTVTGFTFFG